MGFTTLLPPHHPQWGRGRDNPLERRYGGGGKKGHIPKDKHNFLEFQIISLTICLKG